jgi:hypothetical protein
VRLDVSDGLISAISVIITDADDWGFDGDSYLNYSRQEVEGGGWDEVPPAERYGYDELIAAGEAYFAYWGDKTVTVPWASPALASRAACTRATARAPTAPSGSRIRASRRARTTRWRTSSAGCRSSF